MKKLKIFAAVFICLAVIIIACQKEDSANKSTTTETTIRTEKSSVKPGEALSVSIQNATPGTVTKWKVTPNTNVSLERLYSWDHKDVITFNETGTYVISAEIKKVWCDSIVAINPGMDSCLNSGTVTASVQTTVKVVN